MGHGAWGIGHGELGMGYIHSMLYLIVLFTFYLLPFAFIDVSLMPTELNDPLILGRERRYKTRVEDTY